ncbi:uncharacterized protein LOC130897586 [Diorhabda carinulata]|uniref:uncharacterized protein LOC130897586 n=1 Tax=Diorhabda carinulata TaxID=1163345 RepID=UPI0025A21F70|nr:uncharacterized protein LOC130897586 [Diorhabda carinulata]
MTDWTEAKRIARYLKGTADYELRLGEKNEALGLIGYADADYGEDRKTRKSHSGYLFQLFGSPISWACRKQDCVADSSTHAEYIALAEATREGLWIRYLLEDFERKTQETTNQPSTLRDNPPAEPMEVSDDQKENNISEQSSDNTITKTCGCWEKRIKKRREYPVKHNNNLVKKSEICCLS